MADAVCCQLEDRKGGMAMEVRGKGGAVGRREDGLIKARVGRVDVR